MKKTIPTIVGGAMLLSNVTAFAVDETNNTTTNDEITVSSNKDGAVKDESIIEVEGDATDVVEGNGNEVIIPGGADNKEPSKDESNGDSNVDGGVVEEKPSNPNVEGEKPVEQPAPVEPSVPVTPPAPVAPPVTAQEQVANILNNVKSVANQKVMKVKNDNIVVREGSLTTSNQVGTLRLGDYVDVYEQNSVEGWSKINFEGKMSYVNTSDLEDIAVVYKEAVEDNVVVRSGAGVNYGEFGVLSKAQRVQVYQELSNGWSKINYNGKIAFVESTKLQESYMFKATVTLEKVNVFDGTQNSAKLIGEAKKGEILFVYGEEGDFYKVKYGTGFGYIKKADLTIIENTEKPQTGDAMIFSYMGAFGVSVLGMVSVNRKKNR